METYEIRDSLTGAYRATVFPSAGKWRTIANGYARDRFTFKLGGPEMPFPRATLVDLFRPWANTILARWDGVPVYAGLICGTPEYEQATKTVTVPHAELRILMKGRYQHTVYGHVQSNIFTLSGLTLASIAGEIIRRGLVLPDGLDVPSDWRMPVNVLAPVAGGESRSYPADRFQSTEQMLTEVQNSDGGPDIHLQPILTGGNLLQWDARIGSPRLDGPLIERNAAASEGGAVGLTTGGAAENQATGIWMLGEGSENDTRIGRAGDETGPDHPRVPYMDVPRPAKGVSDVEVLNSMARAEWRSTRNPATQVNFDVLAADALPNARVGSTARVWMQDDPWMPDGWNTGYVIGMSHEVGSPLLRLEYQ